MVKEPVTGEGRPGVGVGSQLDEELLLPPQPPPRDPSLCLSIAGGNAELRAELGTSKPAEDFLSIDFPIFCPASPTQEESSFPLDKCVWHQKGHFGVRGTGLEE